MTPKLKLSEDDWKTLLSCMSKFSLPGMRRITKSTHIIQAPAMQAIWTEIC